MKPKQKLREIVRGKMIKSICKCGFKGYLSFFKGEYICRECLCEDNVTIETGKNFSMICLFEEENF